MMQTSVQETIASGAQRKGKASPVTTRVLNEPQQSSFNTFVLTSKEHLEALEISPYFEHIDVTVLIAVEQVFASMHDRRVKTKSYQFLAHTLRFAKIIQRELPGIGWCSVAVITLPPLLELCASKKKRDHYNWPCCYDTTSKYFNLLTARGIFTKPKQKRGEGLIYHFPLVPYTIPENITKRLEDLSKKNKRDKFTRSTALKRAMVDSSNSYELLVDPDEVAQSVQAINDLLQRKQNTTLLPTTIKEIQRILVDQAQYTIQKRRFFTQHSNPSLQINTSIKIVDSSDSGEMDGHRNQKNLPSRSKIVDSSEPFTEFTNISNNINTSELVKLSERGNAYREQPRQESNMDDKKVDSFVEELPKVLTEKQISIQALDLSQRFSPEKDRTAHYARLLREDPTSLRLAVIDAIVRSSFPDPGKKRAKLGGGWITDKYKSYHRKKSVSEASIQAWAKTPYSYNDIEEVIIAASNRCDLLGERTRPFPEEVIAKSAQLVDFWIDGGYRGLEECGYLRVDLDGELLTLREYHEERCALVNALLLHAPLYDSGELYGEYEYEINSYCALVEQKICSREEEAELMAHIPASIQESVDELKNIADPKFDSVRAIVTPRGRWVIEVAYVPNPCYAFLLFSRKELRHCIANWDHVVQSREVLNDIVENDQ